jgi:hypothetical protein
MIKALAFAAAASALAAGSAHAEKWVYYPVPGGAMGYDADSRKADVASSHAVGDTLIYYAVPRAVGPESFSIMIQRLEFECTAARFKVLGTAYFDGEGLSLGQAEGEDWRAVTNGTPPAVFKRIICNNDRPPTAREAADREKLVTALRALPPTSSLTPADRAAAAAPK